MRSGHLRTNKKGKIFLYLLFVALLIGFLFMFNEATEKLQFNHLLGESANDVQSLAWDIALNQTLRDARARLAVATAKQSFFSAGAFANISPCGTLTTTNVWLRNHHLCIPDVLSNYSQYLKQAFPQFFSEPYQLAVLPASQPNTLLIYALLPQPLVVNRSSSSFNFTNDQSAILMQENKNTMVIDHFEEDLFTNVTQFITFVKDCNDKDCVMQALTRYNQQTDYPLQSSCAEGKEKVASSFLNQYLACLDSFQADCICPISLSGNDSFTFFFQNQTVNFGNYQYVHYANTSDYYFGKRYHADNITVTYDHNHYALTFTHNKKTQKRSFQQLLFYKDWDDALLFVLSPEEVAKKSRCQIPEYLEFTFCTKTKAKELVLDPYHQIIALKQLPLSFGIVLQQKKPTKPLDVVVVEDMPHEEDSVKVRFMPDNNPNIVYYRLYYADHPFTDTHDAFFYDEIFLPDTQETLYETSMNLTDGKQWWVAVAPTTMEHQENNYVKSYPIVPVDDVAPGPVHITDVSVPFTQETFGVRFSSTSSVTLTWKPPVVNENGRPIHDLIGYYLFYAPQPFVELPSVENPDQCIQQSGCVFTEDTSFTLTGLPQGTISVVVVAVDDAYNYLKRPLSLSSSSSLIWPAEGPLASCYGWRDLPNGKHDWHHGIDIAVPYGSPVKAIADGVVYSVCINPKNVRNRRSERKCHGFGTNIILYHEQLGTYSRYSHLSRAYVVKGQKVKQGDLIGLVGNTGYSFGTHLDFKYFMSENFAEKPNHYEENPLCYLPPNPFGFTEHAMSCRDSDGDGTQACPVQRG